MSRTGRTPAPGRSRAAASLAGVVVLLLAGCGGDEGLPDLSGKQAKAAQSLERSFLDSGVTGGKGLARAQARCLAEDVVRRVGVADLRRAGLLDAELRPAGRLGEEPLPARVATDVAQALTRCADVERLLETRLLTAAGSPSEVERRCIREVVDADAVARAVALQLQGRSADAMDDVARRLAACAEGR